MTLFGFIKDVQIQIFKRYANLDEEDRNFIVNNAMLGFLVLFLQGNYFRVINQISFLWDVGKIRANIILWIIYFVIILFGVCTSKFIIKTFKTIKKTNK